MQSCPQFLPVSKHFLPKLKSLTSTLGLPTIPEATNHELHSHHELSGLPSRFSGNDDDCNTKSKELLRTCIVEYILSQLTGEGGEA